MKTYTLVLATLLSFTSAYAMDRLQADSLIAQAGRTYAAGDHAKALQLFDSVHTRFYSPALLYNIGNCHFKLNDIPNAILFYERAYKLAPGDVDVRANLDLARQQVVDRVSELPKFTLGSTWAGLRGGNDPDQWARRALWCTLLTFLILALATLATKRSMRRALYAASGLGVLMTLVALGFAAYRHKELTDDSAAIIMTAKVDVRSEPRAASTNLFVLHKGTKVTVLDEEDGWCEVELANGSVGWAPPSSLVRI